jgi:hypothetical protein
MNRIAKHIVTTIAGIAAAAGIALGAYTIGQHHGATVADTATVANYNDGWSDSKVDDCQQGDANACAWLGNAGTPNYAACITYVNGHDLASDICEPLDPKACAYYAQHHYAAPEFCTKEQ